MAIQQPGAVGIMPAGALGVAFFYHLNCNSSARNESVTLLLRRGSQSAAALRSSDILRIAHGEESVLHLSVSKVCRPDLLTCTESGWLPEILLVCTQSDQLLAVISEYVALLEKRCASIGLDAALQELPLLVLSSNGIYHQRVRRYLVEALEESMLYGRLPDLWQGAMGRIVGKLLRGVTMQTGRREGAGPEAIYHPGPAGRTQLAGGDPRHRRRCGEVLQSLGGSFEIAGEESPTRAEFDKALVNLCGNLLGLLKAIAPDGQFRPLTVREIFPEAESPETRELAAHVIAVGRAVQAYRPEEDFETLYQAAMKIARGPLHHVPSTLRLVEAQLRSGMLEPRLPPTERWLLDPLTRYAGTAGLEDSERYFRALIEKLEESLNKAISVSAASSRTA